MLLEGFLRLKRPQLSPAVSSWIGGAALTWPAESAARCLEKICIPSEMSAYTETRFPGPNAFPIEKLALTTASMAGRPLPRE
jgi:hypothetical protein